MPLVALLDRFWPLWGPSWVLFGRSWGILRRIFTSNGLFSALLDAPRSDLGRFRGAPIPQKSCSRVHENANFENSGLCALGRNLTTTLAILWRLLALFGTLFGSPRRPPGALERFRDAPKAPRGHSWDVPGPSWGALGAAHGLPTPPEQALQGFWVHLGLIWVSSGALGPAECAERLNGNRNGNGNGEFKGGLMVDG